MQPCPPPALLRPSCELRIDEVFVGHGGPRNVLISIYH
jgi:hypothetical protein